MSVVAVAGPGMMGRGIAAYLVASGPNEVRLYGRRQEALDEATQKIGELVAFLVANGVAAPECGKLVVTTSLGEAVEGAAFVFESIAENLETKQAFFAELEPLTGPETILCTNTSSLSVTAIARSLSSEGAERFCAAHFIGPAHLVPLVELCPAEQSRHGEDGPVARVQQFLEVLGKKPVVLKREIDGFIAARLQAALYRECLHLVHSGVADCADIDAAVYNGFGRRLNQIGPFQQADFAGVDLVQRTHAKLFPQLGAYEVDLRADELVPQGRLGVKALAGHHDWTKEAAEAVAARRDKELLRRLQADLEQKPPIC